jgi:hypothetical protein
MSTLNLVKDDNGIVVTTTVYDDGTARNLSTATGIALILKIGTTSVTVSGTADPDQTTNRGKCSFTLTSANLATAGKGSYEVQVTEGSTVTTYPSDTAPRVVVRDDLS